NEIRGIGHARVGGVCDAYSIGSTFTIDAPWLLPTHSTPGFFESSRYTRLMFVGRGSMYSVYCPLAMSSRDTRSVSIDPVPASPVRPATASWGAPPGVGTFHSVILSVFGSNMPMALPWYSANHSRPSRSTRPRRGRELGVGVW